MEPKSTVSTFWRIRDTASNQAAPCRRYLDVIVAAVLAGACAAAEAGRPLSTDDAGTAGAGTCQLEGWAERTSERRAYVLAPACGLGETLEVGLDATKAVPRNRMIAEVGAALKWIPAAAQFDTPLGELRLGTKLFFGTVRPVTGTWTLTGAGARALASLQVGSSTMLHLNLGPQRDRDTDTTSVLFNGAVVWAPAESAVLFAETRVSNRRELDGRALSSVGARYWLVKDKIGLDLTASREAGSGHPTTLTFGFGWYGLGIE